MFGLGDTELLLIIIFAFLLFGPDKLPSMGRTIGRGIKQFRQASDSVTKVVKTEVLNPLSEAAKTEAGTPAVQGDATATPIPQLQDRPTETFAERRARLAREREEREAAAAAEAALAADAVEGAGIEDAVVASEPVESEPTIAASTVAEPIEPASEPLTEPVAAQPTIASMWGLDEDAAPRDSVHAKTGEEDATVRTA